MNPEDRPNISRVRSIFDSDDSDDESSGIADNISAILKATSPSNLEKSSNFTADTSSQKYLSTASSEALTSDDENNVKDNICATNQRTIDFDSLLFNDKSEKAISTTGNYASSDDSDHSVSEVKTNIKSESENESEIVVYPNHQSDNESEISVKLKDQSDSDSEITVDLKDQADNESKIAAKLKNQSTKESKILVEHKDQSDNISEITAEMKDLSDNEYEITAEMKDLSDNDSVNMVELNQSDSESEIAAALNDQSDNESEITAELKDQSDNEAEMVDHAKDQSDNESEIAVELKDQSDNESEIIYQSSDNESEIKHLSDNESEITDQSDNESEIRYLPDTEPEITAELKDPSDNEAELKDQSDTDSEMAADLTDKPDNDNKIATEQDQSDTEEKYLPEFSDSSDACNADILLKNAPYMSEGVEGNSTPQVEEGDASTTLDRMVSVVPDRLQDDVEKDISAASEESNDDKLETIHTKLPVTEYSSYAVKSLTGKKLLEQCLETDTVTHELQIEEIKPNQSLQLDISENNLKCINESDSDDLTLEEPEQISEDKILSETVDTKSDDQSLGDSFDTKIDKLQGPQDDTFHPGSDKFPTNEEESNMENKVETHHLESSDVEMTALPSPSPAEEKLTDQEEKLFHLKVKKEKKTSNDDSITNMSVDSATENLQSQVLTKESFIVHHGSEGSDSNNITDMDVDIDSKVLTLTKTSADNLNDTKTTGSSKYNASETISSGNEDELVIDETLCHRGEDLLGFKSGNAGHMKVEVEDIFTDTDTSDMEVTVATSKSIQATSGQEGTIVLPKLDKNAASEHTSTKKQARKPRPLKHNLAELISVFEKGWKREVVYSNRNSARADIYYFAPSGQKLRSTVEIENYIMQEGLLDTKISSFSFRKEPLGVEAKYETVRHALVRGNGDSPASAITTSEKMPTKVVSTLQKKLAPKPVSTKVMPSLPPIQSRCISMMQKKFVTKSYPSPTVPAMRNIPPVKKIPPGTNTQFSTYAPQTSMDYAHSPLQDSPSVQHQSVLTPVIVGENKGKTYHCTRDCLKAVGRVPNLQCIICLCLFHHECCFMPEITIHLILASHAKFLCPNCYIEKSEQEYKMSFDLPPHKDPFSFVIPDEDDEGLGCEISDFLPQHEIKLTAETPSGLEFVRALSPSTILQTPSTTSLDRGLFAYQNGNVAFNSQSASYIPTHTLPTASLPKQIRDVPEDLLLNVGTTIKKQPPIPKKEWLEDISDGYAILKRIFSYLDLPDLLVVAQVCELWKDLAYNPVYWNTVRLRNVCIKDWPKMVSFLKQRRTTHLDMRKMVFRPTICASEPEKEVPVEQKSTPIIREIVEDDKNDVEQVSKEDASDHDNIDENITKDTDDSLPDEKPVLSKSVSENAVKVLPKPNSDDMVLEEASPEKITEVNTTVMASTSGNQNNAKRKLEATEEVGTMAKRQKTNDSEVEETVATTSFLSEHDYYLDMTSYTGMSGQYVDVREEVVDTCKGREALMDSNSDSEQESVAAENEDSEREQRIKMVQGHKNLSNSPQKQKEFSDKETQIGGPIFQQKKPTDEGSYKDWHAIFEQISKLDCLERITLGNTDSNHLEILLFYCRQIQSLGVSNIFSSNGDQACFDPSYLMPVKSLKELRFICSKPFSFKSNFNFIKLPQLKVLMLKGLKTQTCGWPYLGTQLTHLYLSPINNFSKNNWENLANMTPLVQLELESCFDDTNLCSILPRMVNLKKIGLYDWHVGAKLGLTLKRMYNIESLFIMPAKEHKDDRGLYAGRVLALTQSMKGLQEFQWGVQQSIFIEGEEDKIYLRDSKDDTPRPISIESLEGYIKLRRQNTRIVVKRAFFSKSQHGGSNSVLNFRCFTD